MKINSITLVVAFSMAVICLTSCEKDEPEVTNPTPIVDRSVSLQLNGAWGVDAFDMDANYMLDGIAVNFDVVKFYMSALEATSDGASESVEFGKYLLVDASASEALLLGNVAFDQVQQIDFAIGLDEVANHAEEPADAEFPLNQIDMHWNWNSTMGYKFIRIEGFYDSNADGTPNQFFDLHVATDAVYRTGSVEVNTPIADDGTTIALSVDYQSFFSGVTFDPASWEFSDTHGSSNITNAIATNAAAAFSAD